MNQSIDNTKEVRTVDEFMEKHYSPTANYLSAKDMEKDLKNVLSNTFDDFWKIVQQTATGGCKLKKYELRDNQVWTCDLGHFIVVTPDFIKAATEYGDQDKIPCPTCAEIAKHAITQETIEQNTCEICDDGSADYLPDVVRRNGDSGIWEHRLSKLDGSLTSSGEGEYCLASKLYERASKKSAA